MESSDWRSILLGTNERRFAKHDSKISLTVELKVGKEICVDICFWCNHVNDAVLI